MAEGCRRLCRVKGGAGASEETVVGLVDPGGVVLDADVGGAGPDAEGGGVAASADAGGVGPSAEAGGVVPSPDAEGASGGGEAGGAVGGEEEIRCASPGHGGEGGVTFAEVSLGEGGRGKRGVFDVVVFHG